MLRWEKQKGGGWYAYSGELVVGMVVHLQVGPEPRPWVYDVSAVHTKWTTKGHGEVKSCRQAKRSLERAWAAWLARASLQLKQ